MGVGHVLAARGQVNPVLATGAGGALPWWNPDGATPGGVGGIWAYQPKGAASFAASLLDLSGNGNNATDPGGAATPGWNGVDGWIFNGATDYLISTFVPQTDQSQSMICQFTGLSAGGFDAIAGIEEGGRYFIIAPGWRNIAPGRYYGNGSLLAVPDVPQTNGNSAVAGNQGYRDGIADGAVIGGWGGVVPTLPVWIGCVNDGVGARYEIVNIQAIVIYNVALTAPQVLARATAMAAL